jgi:hypothetical protein
MHAAYTRVIVWRLLGKDELTFRAVVRVGTAQLGAER